MLRIPQSLLALLAILVVASPALADSAPRAVPVEPTKDFDVVAKGEPIVHEFEVRNEGNALLELTDVRPACGCTVAEYDREIAAGKTGKVHVVVDTSNFTGPISKSIAVFTNDTANPKLQLVVKANVKPYIVVLPGFARFNYVQGERILPIKQTIFAGDGTQVNIVGVKPPYKHLLVEKRPATAEEQNPKAQGVKQWTVEVSLDPWSPVGPLRDYLVVELDHPKQKTVKIPISGFVRPRQHVTPEKVELGSLTTAALPLRRTLAFTNFATEGIELTEVDTGFDAMTAEVLEIGDKTGHRFKVTLEIGSEMPKGPFDGKIKIRTTDKENPVLEVPISGTIL